MNKIAFKNFRRFIDFPSIDYGNISFLVGRNNSGKSTLVKALLLIIDYLQSDNIRSFSFSKNNIEDVNIVTFDRAKSKGTTDDFIEFEFSYNNFNFLIRVSGKKDNTVVDVNYFRIDDLLQGFSFVIDPPNSFISIENHNAKGNSSKSVNDILLESLQLGEKEIKQRIEKIVDKKSETFISLNNELKSIKDKIKTIKGILKSETITESNFSLSAHFDKQRLGEIIDDAIFEFNAEYEMQYHDIQKGKKQKKDFANLKAFKDSKFKIEKFRSELLSQINSFAFIYLGATLNKQSALFSIRDEKNALAQTIHEFKQLGIMPGEEAHRFVTKWMKESEFEIGDSFEIQMHAGEAYEVMIESHNLKIPLADKGMGSIQAMLLILRLATIIHKKATDKRDYTIIIEEPELNLHPALQSKLADLFHEVYKNFKINVIVETHSEYLIRRTQLVVKENEYQNGVNDNPFCVIYFDKEMKQWKMNYRSDGKFIDDFGKGFYDESSLLTLNLL